MAENDPFAALEPKSVLSDVITQEIINPVPGNSLLTFIDTLTEFEKGLLIGLIIILIMTEI